MNDEWSASAFHSSFIILHSAFGIALIVATLNCSACPAAGSSAASGCQSPPQDPPSSAPACRRRVVSRMAGPGKRSRTPRSILLEPSRRSRSSKARLAGPAPGPSPQGASLIGSGNSSPAMIPTSCFRKAIGIGRVARIPRIIQRLARQLSDDRNRPARIARARMTSRRENAWGNDECRMMNDERIASNDRSAIYHSSFCIHHLSSWPASRGIHLANGRPPVTPRSDSSIAEPRWFSRPRPRWSPCRRERRGSTGSTVRPARHRSPPSPRGCRSRPRRR